MLQAFKEQQERKVRREWQGQPGQWVLKELQGHRELQELLVLQVRKEYRE